MQNGLRAWALLATLWLPLSGHADVRDGVMLKYMVSEQGGEPYPSRIIVTADFVRMDDGEAGNDYLLYDREKQLVSSVTQEDGTVLEIPLRPVTQATPIELKRETVLTPDPKAPAISGKQPSKLNLLVNGERCYDAVVVPGLLPDVVLALREFSRVLAGEQGKLLGELPGDMINGCDLALHTFYPEWPLESGLAIQEWDGSLRQGRLLVDIDQSFQAAPELFTLPQGYRHYQTP